MLFALYIYRRRAATTNIKIVNENEYKRRATTTDINIVQRKRKTEDAKMDRTTAEKEWLRRISGGKSAVSQRKPTSDQSSSKPRPKPQPTAKKHGNGFGDIAGMEDLKQRVKEGFINVLQHRDLADAYGIRPPSMLFYGPAGCGKTFFAEKMAEEVGIHFIKVVPDDLASTMVHGTQEKIGEVFKNAERHAPALLFFDEFDAMVPRRTGNEYNQHYDSEVNEFLCMLNHASDKGVYVLAATNHPECIDKAVLRTGRIDELVYVDMPDHEARKSLFALELAKLPREEDIDMDRLAHLTQGFNCSDINYIVKSAARKKFNEAIGCGEHTLQNITQKQLEEIISGRSPSVSSRDLREYQRVHREFSPKDRDGQPASIGFR